MRKITSLMVLSAVAAVCGWGMSARASNYNLSVVGAEPLSLFLGTGNTASVGNLLFTFTGFASGNTGGNVAPTSAQIAVNAWNFPATSPAGEPGIVFTSGLWSAPNVGYVDSVINFTVTTTDGSLITDDYLTAAGSAPANSQWKVDETVSPLSVGGTLGIIDVNNISGNTTSTATFLPQTGLTIQKDINVLNSGIVGQGTPSITDVEQGFSTVPVPAAAWTGLSTLAGLGVMGLLRKRARA